MSVVRTPHFLSVVAALLLAACASKPIPEPGGSTGAAVETAKVEPIEAKQAKVEPAPVASTPAPSSSTVATVRTDTTTVAAPSGTGDRSVFFDFDDFSIKPEFFPVIERHGKYLASRPGAAVRIEGNADERGTKEYNLALGQKRAEAVAKALKVFGVKDNQVEAVSWGEEKPAATGHDEAAWAKNRRADFEYVRR